MQSFSKFEETFLDHFTHSRNKLIYKGNPLEKATYSGRYIHWRLTLQVSYYVNCVATINFASVQGGTLPRPPRYMVVSEVKWSEVIQKSFFKFAETLHAD